jgi:phosphate transport system protein
VPTAFQKEPATLSHRLADLCALVAIALEEATRSALERDHTLGGRVREDTAAVAAREDQASASPTLHAPPWEDVQAVVAAVCTAVDLTRMGGLAREVAELRRVPVEVRPALGRLGGHAAAAVDAVLSAVVYGRFAGTAALIARRAAAVGARRNGQGDVRKVELGPDCPKWTKQCRTP